ncbi:hypothetical protein GL325_10680 [Aeromicrobium sp. 636]|uniref:SGNH/GDSL hydrolase family protein n=1 Tax=Aeromicrobium senzhongii TaxID=2663859 RepID=A0A8I0K093_9ACTN|nr:MULTISPECIES: SGNH/GDSL hydrolase family protein [Aeromicrobium]MBC9226792.1 SGNH/GDSL hydrolase family protein [Aeromicrobium senzhongii]MCQ3998892.1 hypothetical protein [Aeromicrobium sp. 636]
MPVSVSPWRSAIAALALAAPLLTVAPASATEGGVAPVWDRTANGERYVALGDSFVAGPGLPGTRDAGCGRSEVNLPSLLAAQLDVASFTDASCSAARTTHLWTHQQANDTRNPPQLAALGPDTTLVTLGPMGGNDVDVPGLAWTCVSVGCSQLPVEPLYAAIDELAPVYRSAIAEVRRRAPRAQILAIGYGVFVPDRSCDRLGQATPEDLSHLQGVVDRLSDTIRTVAADEDVTFVDLRAMPGWDEHSACADPADQWIRGLEALEDGGAPLHPSALGMSAMATHVLKTIRPPETASPTEAEPAPPTEAESAPATAGPSAPPVVTPAPATPGPTTPTPTPTTRPRTATPPPPSSAQRVTAAAKSLRVRAQCVGPRQQRRVRLSVSGGHGLVTRATFRIGKRPIATDRRAPFATTRRESALRRAKVRGRVLAAVTLRHGAVVRTTTVSTRLPGCLR